jgi:hypothetical protein
MDTSAQHSVLHDDFLKASEAGKVTKEPTNVYHPNAGGKQTVATATVVKNAVFRTMSEVLLPTAPSKTMWMLEFLIVWAQVCPPVLAGGGKFEFCEVVLWVQTLSFVLSDSSELLWSATVLKPLTSALSMLCLRNIESDEIEEVAVYAAIGLVSLVLGTFVWVGTGLLTDRPIPPWILKVCDIISV